MFLSLLSGSQKKSITNYVLKSKKRFSEWLEHWIPTRVGLKTFFTERPNYWIFNQCDQMWFSISFSRPSSNLEQFLRAAREDGRGRSVQRAGDPVEQDQSQKKDQINDSDAHHDDSGKVMRKEATSDVLKDVVHGWSAQVKLKLSQSKVYRLQ